MKLQDLIEAGPVVFIPVSDMRAYERWDDKQGKYQVYDDSGIHVHGKTELYFKRHVSQFEQELGQ